MNPARLARFHDCPRYFICPLCHAELNLAGTSLRCPNRHTFDIAKQGYVNLAPAAKQSQFYSKESVANRGRILNAGYYSHIASAVLAAVRTHCPANPRPAVLDAGCGEGFYARAVQQANPQADVLAFDISKDSVQQAAREDTSLAVRWFVGNLADLPLRDAAVDCILDVFSPVHYGEFGRVLRPGGIVVKAVPGARHDEQLRELASAHLRHTDYSNEQTVDQFARHFDVLDTRLVSQTFAMPPNDVRAFAHMTPLLFNVDIDALDLGQIHELTVEAQVLVGRNRADSTCAQQHGVAHVVAHEGEVEA